MVVMMIVTMKAIIRLNKRFPSDELPRTASVETARGRPITHTNHPYSPSALKFMGFYGA